MLKRTLILLLPCLAALFAITSCAAHTHTAGELWDGDASTHWRACECGEKMDMGAHDEGGDMFDCSVCGAAIIDMDEEIEVCFDDPYGHTERCTVYDKEGNIVRSVRYAHTYDDEGNMLTEKYYDGIRLAEEKEYAVDTDGELRIVKSITYSEDGSCTVTEYDQHGNIISSVSRDAYGNTTLEIYSEYAAGEDGNLYERKSTWETAEETFETFYNEYGDTVYRATYNNKDHRLTQQLRYEREYDESRNVLWEKEYIDDVLVHEITGYAEVIGDDFYMRYPEKTIDYNDDGSRLVTENGYCGDVASETLYDANGNVLRVSTYEYTYDRNDNRTSMKQYNDGALAVEEVYSYSADGWVYMSRKTEYSADGSYVVYEYDENEALVNSTVHSA